MTYRERLLEKCGFDDEVVETAADSFGMCGAFEVDHFTYGAKWAFNRSAPVITALLDECERLSSVLASIDYGFEPKRPGASLAGGWPIHPNSEVHKDIKRTIAAHAAVMEALCNGKDT